MYCPPSQCNSLRLLVFSILPFAKSISHTCTFPPPPSRRSLGALFPNADLVRCSPGVCFPALRCSCACDPLPPTDKRFLLVPERSLSSILATRFSRPCTFAISFNKLSWVGKVPSKAVLLSSAGRLFPRREGPLELSGDVT